MPTLVVEIHVPLTPDRNAVEGENPFPWIEDLEEFTTALEETGEAFVVEEGDEFEGHYVIVLTGAEESTLIALANRVSAMPGIPTGVFAMLTDDEAEELGQGTKVDVG